MGGKHTQGKLAVGWLSRVLMSGRLTKCMPGPLPSAACCEAFGAFSRIVMVQAFREPPCGCSEWN